MSTTCWFGAFGKAHSQELFPSEHSCHVVRTLATSGGHVWPERLSPQRPAINHVSVAPSWIPSQSSLQTLAASANIWWQLQETPDERHPAELNDPTEPWETTISACCQLQKSANDAIPWYDVLYFMVTFAECWEMANFCKSTWGRHQFSQDPSLNVSH